VTSRDEALRLGDALSQQAVHVGVPGPDPAGHQHGAAGDIRQIPEVLGYCKFGPCQG
jgi:hypothetical protein